MLVPIIVTAVIAFLVVLCIIYFKEIKSYLKNKFFKKKSKKSDKPKEDKKAKVPEFTVEDFKPAPKVEEDNVRDASLENLFAGDDEYFNDLMTEFPSEMMDGDFNSVNNDEHQDVKFDDDFIDFTKYLEKDNKKDNRPISERIKDLPPDIKALLIDNVLKRKDDI